MESTSSKSVKSSVTGALKRNSDDVGWEYGQLANPNNNDKMKCNLCHKIFSGGVYRMKEHIAQRGTNVTHCKIAKAPDQMKCANALDAVKRKNKAKVDAENGIRASVNINGDEPVDLDPCFGDFRCIKKRNRLEPGKVSDLVYVEFNANLIEKNKKRKLRNREVLLADADGGNAEEWITGRTSEPRGVDNEVHSGPVISNGVARTSEPRVIDDEFESEDEVEDVEIEYESDGVEIITRGGGQEQCGGQVDELDDL